MKLAFFVGEIVCFIFCRLHLAYSNQINCDEVKNKINKDLCTNPFF